ncbi:TetR/AcrR family transcriptional regulator [Streptomyces sp. NPDC127038]|uniref:TetR/AcrR family transcriptional regulator n=1 Tax=Streptomyces sp. NPDC127038 TaxID=3347114 RepID=UPI00365364AC
MPTRKVEVRREQILHATIEVLREHGFAKARVKHVAEQLGISYTLVYYHFPTREKLLADTFTFLAEDEAVAMRRIAEGDGNAIEKMRAAISPITDDRPTTRWIPLMEGWVAALRVQEVRSGQIRYLHRWLDSFQRIIEQGNQEGSFHCASPEASAWRINALLDGVCVQLASHDGALPCKTAYSRMWDGIALELGCPTQTLAPQAR